MPGRSMRRAAATAAAEPPGAPAKTRPSANQAGQNRTSCQLDGGAHDSTACPWILVQLILTGTHRLPCRFETTLQHCIRHRNPRRQVLIALYMTANKPLHDTVFQRME